MSSHVIQARLDRNACGQNYVEGNMSRGLMSLRLWSSISVLVLGGSFVFGCREEPDESSNSSAVLPAPGQSISIDFEASPLGDLQRGDLVDEQYASIGVHFNAAFSVGTRSIDFQGCTTAPITENMLCTWVAWKDTGVCFEPVGGESAQLVIDVDFPVCEVRIDGRTRCDLVQDGDVLEMQGFATQDTSVPPLVAQSFVTNTGPSPTSENKIDGILTTTFQQPIRRIVIEDGTLDSLDNVRLTRCGCSPPEITCPAPITVECTGSRCGDIVPPPATATGECTPITVTGPGPQCFPLGTTTTTYTATSSDGQQVSCQSSITVVDTTPPVIETVPILVDGALNHSYETIRLSDCVESVLDQCTGPGDILTSGTIVRITSDEPEQSGGDGNTCNDIVIVDDTTAQVRRERQGGGGGRVYTIHFTVDDGNGNEIQSSCRVDVCDAASQCPATDSGCAYCVGSGCETCPGDDPTCN